MVRTVKVLDSTAKSRVAKIKISVPAPRSERQGGGLDV